MEILVDNKTSLTLIRDLKSQKYNKHINVIYHHIQGLMKDKELEINWIFSSLMLANDLINTFFIRPFKRYQEK